MPRLMRSLMPAAATVLTVCVGVAVLAGPADAGSALWRVGRALAVTNSAKPTTTKTTKPTTKKPVTTTKTTAKPTATKTTTTAANPDTSSGTAPFLGTLVTHISTAGDEAAAGIKMAMVEIAWRNFEPSPNVFDMSYANTVAKNIVKLQNAGMRVTLGLGLHYTPSWVLALPNSHLVDQYGKVSSGTDLIFDQNVRDAAAAYLAKVAQVIDMSTIYAVRITSGTTSEMQYPGAGSYWAFSPSAQNGSTMATSMPANPLPGFRPSVTTPTPSAANLSAWEQWYVGALANVADWQMSQLVAGGFDGYFQIITPGQGVRPTQLPAIISKGLPDGITGRGAVWSQLYADLQHRTNITAYVSSVADGSGGDDVCQPGDDSVALDDPAVYLWSASRWISRIAAANGFTVAGENPGFSTTASLAAHYRDLSANGLIAKSMAQARGCGFLGIYWAHDDQLWNGTIDLSALAGFTSPSAVLPALAS